MILLGIQIGEFFHNIKDPTNETNSKEFFYQQSITALLSVGNQEINSTHFIFFSKYIYIYYISHRDAMENVAFTGVKIIASKRKVNTSLSQPTRRGKQTPFHRACSRSLRPR